MAKSEDEKLWGVSLSVAVRGFQMAISIVNQTCQQMGQRIAQFDDEKKDSQEYLRLVHLMTMTGGIKYVMEGVDGMTNALVLDLLKDFREESGADNIKV